MGEEYEEGGSVPQVTHPLSVDKIQQATRVLDDITDPIAIIPKLEDSVKNIATLRKNSREGSTKDLESQLVIYLDALADKVSGLERFEPPGPLHPLGCVGILRYGGPLRAMPDIDYMCSKMRTRIVEDVQMIARIALPVVVPVSRW